ncbi:sialate O-acetylesterase [Actinobacillus pleuropneumoniae]|uniref:Sialate O-acetylesterase domain-containing protein n=1 Tax=Actinobacillus pleuropneumoniae TaxID=715 RepID=A0ABM6X2V7_ACTPL|nr:sialate O-acetylesterase [Actinobacillus pleuropneumoniae]ASU16492.1 hypothetical protein CHY23_01748 [Actinobacillus pleuropneumoniae]AWG94945.1 hypothetical protein APPSER1_02870 [Actinobacillus pleuropneumoniae serovar 1 str. 4074]AXA21017.1 hypothetical protein DRF63_02865 [Actinobacillus pleuropneumoniae]EFM94588.1 hypothetical protein appser9_5810 [Actinobacillus pleuropneumoniae serovar 9 str. CVJ13261]EFM98998.1 hypothetical protein appser11_5890 [Actinobacillus pleuropneumoniae ser
MAIAEQHLVNIGRYANDGKGDSARVAFEKLNKLIIQLDSNIKSGAIGYLDYSSMQLDQSKPDGTIAQLTNGDLYIRLNGEWVKSIDKTEAQSAEFDKKLADVARSVVNVNLYESQISLAQAWTDNKDKIAIGITERGDFYQPSAEQRESGFPGWGVTDNQDRLLMGFNTATAEFVASDKREGFTSTQAFVQTDSNYKVSEQSLVTGEKYVPAGIVSDAGICFLQNGDVYLQKGSVTTQITQRGDVVACEMSGSAVRYVAPRRGLFLTYEWRDGETSQVFEPCDIDGYFLTGQSLAVSMNNPAINTAAIPENAFTISTGPMWHKEWSENIRGIIKLQERYYETIMSNFGKAVLEKKDKPIIVFGSGKGGRNYASLIKGGESGAYEKVITAMQFIQNTPYKTSYKAMLVIHGEQDGKERNTNYDKNLADWLDSYTKEIQTITGQNEKPVMLMCQTAGAANYYPNLSERHLYTTPFLQLKASAEHPRIFAVTPKYMFNCTDGIHIDGKSADILGDYYAKVKHLVVDKGEDWLGLRPIKCHKSGTRTVDITFNVPNPPLVFDTIKVTEPGNYGFYLYNGNGVTISKVALDAENNKVVITTSDDIPDGASITYAFDNGIGGNSGPTKGARGCLRDSCTDLSTDGTWMLHNWCFAFEEKLTN